MNNRTDLVALAAGVIFAALGVSGILNSSALLPHPGWVPIALVVAALAAAATVRSGQSLLRASNEIAPDRDTDA